MLPRWVPLAAVCCALAATLPGASQVPSGAGKARPVFLVPNFHPASCGWLTDFSNERSYCANSYLAHLDRVRDDPAYRFAFSEVNNQMAVLAFAPGRAAELRRRLREGRAELCNAFFLEPTINLSGGEALVRMGVEGLRWQQQVMDVRPRLAWCIDVTGVHEQMAQIVSGLDLDGIVYTRDNPTGSALHWLQSPDGTRALALSPGHYSEWGDVFATQGPLDAAALGRLRADALAKAGRTPLELPVLVLGGAGDYALPPARRSYPSELLRQWGAAVPDVPLRFATPSSYLDAILPTIRSQPGALPVSRGGARMSWTSFWIQNPTVKGWYRRAEHGLQSAEAAATVASLRAGARYPAQRLYEAWLQMLLNMDRNTLWGAAAGVVFDSPRSWDASDRFRSVETMAAAADEAALRSLMGRGSALGMFNALNWDRSDPVSLALPPGRRLAGAPCQADAGGRVVCQPRLPSVGYAGLRLVHGQPDRPAAIPVPAAIDTPYYTARIDRASGALVSLRTKPSGRELLARPVLLVAEAGGDYHSTPGRSQRRRLADTSGPAQVRVLAGPVATDVEASGRFVDGKPYRQRIRFYRRSPRIDFRVTVEDIPNRTVVVAEVPLAPTITEVRRGIPYGFSHAAWGRSNPALPGYGDGIVPAIRWSSYEFDGGGLAILDRGLPGRELDGQTPVLFLLNAQGDYMGFPCAWLSGRGRQQASFAIVAYEGPWSRARVPQMAWEFNSPPVVLQGVRETGSVSAVRTSPNVIVEALRRDGREIELRMVEWTGDPGVAEVMVRLPHGRAAVTDLVGGRRRALPPGDRYHIAVRPQQIVTLRFAAPAPVPAVRPLLAWDPLVPAAKRAALRSYLPGAVGHPPHAEDLPVPTFPADAAHSLTLGRPARASNVYRGVATYGAASAVDGSPATRWATDDGASEATLEVDLGRDRRIARAYLSEAYDRVRSFALERLVAGRWQPFARGTRVGTDLSLRFPPVVARQVRLHVLEGPGGPTVREFMLFER